MGIKYIWVVSEVFLGRSNSLQVQVSTDYFPHLFVEISALAYAGDDKNQVQASALQRFQLDMMIIVIWKFWYNLIIFP